MTGHAGGSTLEVLRVAGAVERPPGIFSSKFSIKPLLIGIGNQPGLLALRVNSWRAKRSQAIEMTAALPEVQWAARIQSGYPSMIPATPPYTSI